MKVWIVNEGAERRWTEMDLENDFTFSYFGINHESQAFEVVKVGALTDCRFQILLEIGLNHLAQGQYRDAVISVQAALERYREFYLLSSIVKGGFKYSDFENLLKIIGKQSERQLGAYHAMMMVSKGGVGKDLSNTMVSYRNKVVHGGYFPDEKNTIAYCMAVVGIMQEGLSSLLEEDNRSVIKAAELELTSRLPSRVDYQLSVNPLVNFSGTTKNGWISNVNGHLDKLRRQTMKGITWPNYSWLNTAHMEFL